MSRLYILFVLCSCICLLCQAEEMEAGGQLPILQVHKLDQANFVNV
jgi:hypothetical protein